MSKFKIVVIISAGAILLLLWIGSTNWCRFKLAEFYDQKGSQDKAIAIYEKIFRKSELTVNNPLVCIFKEKLSAQQKYDLAMKLAPYYLASGYKNKAANCYEILKELHPENIADYQLLYVLTGNEEKLIDIILESKDRALIDKLPAQYVHTPLWRYYYGVGLAKRGRYQEAKDEFLKLTAEYPYLYSFHYCLSYIFQELGLESESKEEREIAQFLNPACASLPDGESANHKNFDFVGIWNLDEDPGSSDILRDISGQFNNGQIKGAKWVKGICGSALEFDGVDDTAIISDNPDFDFDGKDFTIAMWIKPVPQKKCRFVYFKPPNLYIYPDDITWSFQLENVNGSSHLRIGPPVCGEWYFVVQKLEFGKEHKAMLFDRQGLIASVDEKDVTATTESNGNSFCLSGLGRAGMWGSDMNAYFQGNIDEIYMFKRALTDNEIQGLYENFNFNDNIR